MTYLTVFLHINISEIFESFQQQCWAYYIIGLLFYLLLHLLSKTRSPFGISPIKGRPCKDLLFFSLFSTKENNFLIPININKFLNEKNDTEIKNYIEQFFVGLLEGDSTISVDFVNNCKKRIRIIIALKNLENNRFMLNLIIKYVGGRVVIERNDRYVTWYATNKTDIAKVLAILAKYPLLSTRKQCQLNFAKDFINSNIDMSKEEFNKLRSDKYKNQKKMIDFNQKNFEIPMYFPSWLSGFIEAEGHFKLVKKANNTIESSQFIIGQNHENYLLKAILIYFNQENRKISYTFNKEGVAYYRLHLGGKDFRSLLVYHFNDYPLIGNRRREYMAWNEGSTMYEDKGCVIASVTGNNQMESRGT